MIKNENRIIKYTKQTKTKTTRNNNIKNEQKLMIKQHERTKP